MSARSDGAPATGATATRAARLTVAHVAKTYRTYGLWPLVRSVPVLRDASLEVSAGETVALVGESG